MFFFHRAILRLKKKYEKTGNVKDKQRPGWPPKLNERNERTIIRRLLIGEYTTAVSLTKSIQVNEDIEVSAETIRRVLRKNGFATRAKRKKPLLSKKHREKRLDFAKKFKDWTVQDWSRVVWSDESKFQIFSSDGREYCWRKQEKLLKDAHIKPTVKFGGGSVFVWVVSPLAV